jgi:DNA-binding CsgD family transcriptional regulator
MDTDQAVVRGQLALKEGRWADARDTFEAALAIEERPDAVQGLGDALWWLGDGGGCLRAMERAYTMYRESGEVVPAIAMCLGLSGVQLKSMGNRAACRGWIATAERLAEQAGLQEMDGWLLWARSAEATEPNASADYARRSLEIARQSVDRDLELCAMSELGKALVGLGRVAEGMALIDEAMAGAMGGEAGGLDTVVATCCSMMGACDQAADLDRVAEWCRAADRFMQTYGSPFLYADCRLRYGSVLLATGHWADAERELRAAAEVTTRDTDYYRLATARLAELRLRQGRQEEAEKLLAQIPDSSAGLLPLAELHHLRGQNETAARLLHRLLEGGELERVDRARAVDLMVGCRLAEGDAGAAARALQAPADPAAPANQRVEAHRVFAEARVALAEGAAAEEGLERAMRLFSNCKLPYETARVRLVLAKALSGSPEIAVSEAQGAFSTFERLGAVADADEAARLIRSLGGAARTGPKDAGVLTKREQEVLRLLGAGLSNPEIAERLFLSRKTVSHHVSNVLGKLGLRNRSEAALQAERILAST